MRPMTCLSFFRVKVMDPYWSLISLLGTMMDSRRSCGLNFPAALLRSGPMLPPS